MLGKIKITLKYTVQKSARRKLERKIIFSFFVYERRTPVAMSPIRPTIG